MAIASELKALASVDLFGDVKKAAFVGRPFYFDYSVMKLLANDKWKQSAGGIPAGAFLLARYDNEAAPNVAELVLLRVLGPTSLPSDPDVTAAMVDYYKENVPSSAAGKLDSYTRGEFQFSGLECRVLGCFYRDDGGTTLFGADVDNFYSPNNYSVYKPAGRVLEYIVNFREGKGVPGGEGDQRIGEVRYSSSKRHANAAQPETVAVYVSSLDYLGKRTALFGMTRTGKSNTLKKIIEATAELSKSGSKLGGIPIAPVGQIIFDVNGEYANDNQQDEGTALYQLYKDSVTRYSILEKPGFKVMKLNFYADLVEGFELIRGSLQDDDAIYTKAFLNVSWETPDSTDHSATTRFDRRSACYKCILHAAGLTAAAQNAKVKFEGGKELNDELGLGIDPSKGISLDEASNWFTRLWATYEESEFITDYRKKKGRDWADEDLKSLLRFLTRCAKPGSQPTEAGFRKLVPIRELHTASIQQSFADDIVARLRKGEIVIVDLSQGDPVIQRMYSERLCRSIFVEAMARFVSNKKSNFIQMCFEEAHNLFPKKAETDLTNIYNRLAKEGAKLGIGLVYATQEVSSISANVLKNTQNWFVSHLNNDEELREVAKYYDFEDFVESLRRATDKGFIRMKTYSNAFTVPIQMDRFTAGKA